jgi:Domain of unknown function (DUF397)
MLTPEWRKSSHSNAQASCVEVKGVWRKSTHSNGQANRAEVRPGSPAAVAIRDSKNPAGAVLTVTPGAWSSFTTIIKHGNLDV